MVGVDEKNNYLVRKIDGLVEKPGSSPLTREQWAAATVLTDFSFPWLDRQAPQTIFRALWDTQNFYFRFEVSDTDVVMAEGADAGEKVSGSDRVEIFFTRDDDLSLYYGLEMDPRAYVLSYEARFYRRFDQNWKCPDLKTWSELTKSGANKIGL